MVLEMGLDATVNENFEVVHRPHGDCWKHKTQDFWVVFYEALKLVGKPCFYAYRAIEGSYQRDPWTVNNRRVGQFNSLEDAMAMTNA